jgi:hypothetical protein
MLLSFTCTLPSLLSVSIAKCVKADSREASGAGPFDDETEFLLDCLKFYCSTELDELHKLLHRFHQLLRQLFSADSILQLVSPNAIEPLSRFGSSEPPMPPEDELGPQVPAFVTLFKNLDSRVLVRPDHLIAANLQHYATVTRGVDSRLQRLAVLMA